MTKKHALQYFICNLNFKSHNFQTESPFKRAASTYRGSTTLSFFSPCYALCLGHTYIASVTFTFGGSIRLAKEVCNLLSAIVDLVNTPSFSKTC